MIINFKIFETISSGNGEYLYRIYPKGDINNVLKRGLLSYSPGEMPGTIEDNPEDERWGNQDLDDLQTYRIYFTSEIWPLENKDRFRLRVHKSVIEDKIIPDENFDNDYFIDTGTRWDIVLEPREFDIEIGGRWQRADTVDPIMINTWIKNYYRDAGFYGNE